MQVPVDSWGRGMWSLRKEGREERREGRGERRERREGDR